jgi:hypothetical protein
VEDLLEMVVIGFVDLEVAEYQDIRHKCLLVMGSLNLVPIHVEDLHLQPHPRDMDTLTHIIQI